MVDYKKKQKRISEEIAKEGTLAKWRDWNWQLEHSIKTIQTFEEVMGIEFNSKKRKKLKETIQKFPLSITPYYLSLINVDNYEMDPLYKQAFLDPRELNVGDYEVEDPLAEEKDSPVEGITHRYPDRVLFLVSNRCSMYCRHCTRKRKVGDPNSIPSKSDIQKGLDYLRETPQVRDVLLSGGDPLMLSNEYLDWILSQLDEIPHIEIVRIGSRMPAVLPYRITDDLVNMLKKHHPLWVNTHFNHPREITSSSRTALKKLANAGIPLGNQSVLLAGINDCPRIMKKLVHELVQNRVRPYYLFQCDLSPGLEHFRTPVSKGVEILEHLIGHTTGFAVPRYVIDAPGGGGKIPIMPDYLISWGTNKVILRNYEGVICSYKEPDSYETDFCDRECANCTLRLNLEETESVSKAIGITKLLSSNKKVPSPLTPEKCERLKRRNTNEQISETEE
ncbi:MAG: lysine 2,3-aminomutase [Promethearchaeia archaeon]